MSKATDRRKISGPINGLKGGRPVTVGEGKVYSLKVPDQLHTWLKRKGPDAVRRMLAKGMIEEHIV